MKRKLFLIILLISFLCAQGCSTKKSNNSPAEIKAVNSAEAWLSLIDNQKYEESWIESAELFRNAISAPQWQSTVENVRKPLGELVSREVKAKNYKTSLPGVPDGEYVVIQFKSSFTNKKSSIETVTPMIDKDGKWRVSGYFIK